MAASVRSAAANNSGSATATSVVVAKPAGTASGDILYGLVHTNDSGPTITPPSGFAEVIAPFATGGTNLGGMACYRKVAGGAEPADYTWTVAAATRFCVGMVAVQGADTATPEDVTGTATTGSANPGTAADAPSVDPATTDALLLCAMGGTVGATGTQVTATPPSGMTEQADQSTTNAGAARNSSLEVSSLALASGAATGVKTNTVTSSISWGGLSVAVRSAAAAAGAPPRFLSQYGSFF